MNSLKKRVLVVEDHAPLLRAVSLCLQRAGYDVLRACDGDEAFFRIAETLPDVIVSDIMMPGVDGFMLAEQIRSNPRTDLVPIIVLTARDNRTDRIRGFRAGIDAYLVKPFEPEELEAALQSIFARVQRTHTRVVRSPSPQGTENRNDVKAFADEAERPGMDLTDAEMRIAEAVSRGLSNKEIASQISISVRTVEMHISHVLRKMNWSNRVEIARYIFARHKQP